ncbi:MAG: carboxypeptidase-like regulatory domain-containing protein [Bacteroidales bacterium]|nr:carboxypeptidase-like regulatory domain-containing protein [Bacteroidales bacterium]
MAQSIQFGSGRITIRKAIETIESQTRYRISYNNSKLDVNQEIQTTVPNGTIDEVMPVILARTGYSYRIDGNYIVIIQQSREEKTTKNTVISGSVRDESGAPIPGVGILIDGTTRGAMTDINGTFSLTIPSGDVVLEVSSMGYVTQKVPVPAGQKNINITLKEDITLLEETIVIGYGTQKKVNLTGAVSSVESKELENRSAHNPSLGWQKLR